jgi:hypothetical protein
MGKKLNAAAILNELSGGSAFFPSYKRDDSPPPPLAETSPTPAPQSPIQQPETATPERSNARTPVRSNTKRIITRNSFEIYEDQMDSLRDRSYKEKRAGKIGSMSAMVRRAIDKYLLEEPLEE